MKKEDLLSVPVKDLLKNGLLEQALIADYEKQKRIEEENRSFVRTFRPTAYVISDNLGLNGVQSMLDGKSYDSKSEYRKHLKREGYVELGNDAPKTVDSNTRGEFVSKKEIAEVLNRYS